MGKLPKAILYSPEDAELISAYTWSIVKRHNTYYAVRQYLEEGKPKAIYMHRAIMNPPKNMEIDHINRNGLDNRRENLRIVTHAENMVNSGHKLGISGCRGVRKTSGGLWAAIIKRNGKRTYLGSFKTKKAAQKAWVNAAAGNFSPLYVRNVIENFLGHDLPRGFRILFIRGRDVCATYTVVANNHKYAMELLRRAEILRLGGNPNAQFQCVRCKGLFDIEATSQRPDGQKIRREVYCTACWREVRQLNYRKKLRERAKRPKTTVSNSQNKGVKK